MNIKKILISSLLLVPSVIFADMHSHSYSEKEFTIGTKEVILRGENSATPQTYTVPLEAKIVESLYQDVFYKRTELKYDFATNRYVTKEYDAQRQEFLDVLDVEFRKVIIKIEIPALPLLRGEKETMRFSYDGIDANMTLSSNFIDMEYEVLPNIGGTQVVKVFSVKRKMDAVPVNNIVASYKTEQGVTKFTFTDSFHDDRDDSTTNVFYKVSVDRRFLPRFIKHTIQSSGKELDKNGITTVDLDKKIRHGARVKVCYEIQKDSSDKFDANAISQTKCFSYTNN